jgi:hypothetical protein
MAHQESTRHTFTLQKPLGVWLEERPQGGVVVADITQGGSALSTGLLEVGDVLLQVDNQSVITASLGRVQALFGAVNKAVTMEVLRSRAMQLELSQRPPANPIQDDAEEDLAVAATAVQCAVRRVMARRRIGAARERLKLVVEEARAAKLQVAWRRRQQRQGVRAVDADERWRERQLRRARYTVAAMRVQRRMRHAMEGRTLRERCQGVLRVLSPGVPLPFGFEAAVWRTRYVYLTRGAIGIQSVTRRGTVDTRSTRLVRYASIASIVGQLDERLLLIRFRPRPDSIKASRLLTLLLPSSEATELWARAIPRMVLLGGFMCEASLEVAAATHEAEEGSLRARRVPESKPRAGTRQADPYPAMDVQDAAEDAPAIIATTPTKKNREAEGGGGGGDGVLAGTTSTVVPGHVPGIIAPSPHLVGGGAPSSSPAAMARAESNLRI